MFYRRRMFFSYLLFACVILLWGSPASARDLISGKYISSAGRSIILDLDVKGPSISNLIVHQFLSADVDIIHSSPPLMKFDRKSGKAQWLIKKVKPGHVRISMELSKAILPGHVRAEVRCRDQETGQMMDIAINP